MTPDPRLRSRRSRGTLNCFRSSPKNFLKKGSEKNGFSFCRTIRDDEMFTIAGEVALTIGATLPENAGSGTLEAAATVNGAGPCASIEPAAPPISNAAITMTQASHMGVTMLCLLMGTFHAVRFTCRSEPYRTFFPLTLFQNLYSP